jgi:pimeloyl-ACP methyl ester carboxylesterase
VALITGGLWDGMTPSRFWGRHTIRELKRAGFTVLTPDRPLRPRSWADEIDALSAQLPQRTTHFVAGSNGCSVAVRFAALAPDRVGRIVLAWPASGGDAELMARYRWRMEAAGADRIAARNLLQGDLLRGVAASSVLRLKHEVAVVPAEPEDDFHRVATVDAICRLLPHARRLPATPPSPRPEFKVHVGAFVAAVVGFLSDPQSTLLPSEDSC